MLSISDASASGIEVAPALNRIGDSQVATLDAVIVSGEVPGPGLWRVTKGINELWIFGTLSPLPKSIRWNSNEVRSVIATTDVVLWKPYFYVNVDAGLLKKLSLGYSYIRAQRNPNGETLQDVLPVEVFERWSRLQVQYIPENRSVFKKRPVAAANELFEAVVRSSNLTDEDIVWKAISEAAKGSSTPIYTPRYTLQLSKASATDILKDARHQSVKDVDCLVATMDLIEKELPLIVASANAWATGDLERIDATGLAKRESACSGAFSNSELAADHGVPDIQQSISKVWMMAAEQSLDRYARTVAFLPIADLTMDGGYIDQLRARGYQVEYSPTEMTR